MKVNFYLVVNRNGTIRTCKNTPNLAIGEIAIKQNLTLPDLLFRKPHLEATVVIPDDAAVPHTIDAEVQMNVREAIQQATGLQVRLTIADQPE